MNTIGDSVMALQQQVLEVNNVVTNHEERMKTIESTLNNTLANFNPDEIHREVADRSRRAKNLILLNVPENQGPVNDLDFIRRAFSTLPTPSVPHAAFRLGQVRSGSRPRPLKVIFNAEHDARSVLLNKDFLQSNNYIARSDLTPSQLKHLQDLRRELETRARNGEDNLTIRYISGTPMIVPMGNARARDMPAK